MIEKICDFIWKPDGETRQMDTYYFDGRNVLLGRAGGQPQLKWDGHHEMLGKVILAQLNNVVKKRGYDTMQAHTQKLYNFLNARLGD